MGAHEAEAEGKFSDLTSILAYCKWHASGESAWAGLSGQENKSSRGKLNLIITWFNAAATTEELAVMRDRDEESGKKEKIAQKLHRVVRQRLLKAFIDEGAGPKDSLTKGKIIASTGLESRL